MADLPADYAVTMADSYGDGWNGNVLNIGGTEYAGPGSELAAGEAVVETVGHATLLDVQMQQHVIIMLLQQLMMVHVITT